MDYVKAFLVGGLIYSIAQVLIDKTKLTPARILVMYVTIGAILGGLSIYKKLIDKEGQELPSHLWGSAIHLHKVSLKQWKRMG